MHTRNFSFFRSRSFTLIEMLVVIAIISILASMMMPALMRAGNHVKKTACANNMRQTGISFAVYANDNADMVIIDWNNVSWVKYLTNFQIDQNNAMKEIYTRRFHCPATFQDWDGTTYSYRESFYLATVYGGNLNAAGFSSISTPEPSDKNPMFPYICIRLSRVVQAERKVKGKLPLISEGVFTDNPNLAYFRFYLNGNRTGVNLAAHNGLANYLLSDGHVETGDLTVFKNEIFSTRGSLDGVNIIDF